MTAATPQVESLVMRCEPGSDRFSCATEAMQFAARAGVPSRLRWQLGITICELVSNVLRHARHGEITLSVETGRERQIVVVCSDVGPGLADAERARRDGYSRGRQLLPEDPRGIGLGAGLGAVHRLMDRVEIRSAAGCGTVIIAKLRF